MESFQMRKFSSFVTIHSDVCSVMLEEICLGCHIAAEIHNHKIRRDESGDGFVSIQESEKILLQLATILCEFAV